MREEAVAMLENLKDQVMETGAKLNVGIVIFNRQANNVLELTELNEEDMAKIEAAMTEDIKRNESPCRDTGRKDHARQR